MGFHKTKIAAGATAFDPKTTLTVYSDFMGVISTTVPDGPFIGAAANSGYAGANAPADTTSSGVCQLGTSTSATASGTIRTQTTNMTFAGGPSTFECGLVIPVLSTGAERFFVRAGFGNSGSAAHQNGAYFEGDAFNNANWYMVSANAGSRTTTSTGVAMTTNKVTLKIAVAAEGTSATYYIDGVSVGTISTNLPPPDISKLFGVIVHMVKSVGTTSRTVDVDYIHATKTYTTPRK